MNQETKLDNLRLKEYEQQQKIEQLRKSLFNQTNKTLSTEMDKLLEAEKELLELGKKRNSLEAEENRGGLIIDETIKSSTDSNTVVRGRDFNQTKSEVAIEVYVGMDYLPTAIYHLFEPVENPLVLCNISVKGRGKKFKITSYIEGYSAKAINTIQVKADSTEYISQLPTLFPHLIKSITELTKATLHIKVEEIGGNIEREESYIIPMLSRNSILFSYFNFKTQKRINILKYLATFVTPNQPDIIRFLRTIGEFHPENSLGGYQGNELEDKEFKSGKHAVTLQVKAIFDALKATNLIYVNSTISYNPIRNIFGGQRVRLPKETLNEQQANCLDGAFLYASLLEACSLNPAIVLITGHAFVAWETWQGTDEWRFLETTMINKYRFEEACKIGDMTAQKHYEEESLTILPINKLRAMGVMPME